MRTPGLGELAPDGGAGMERAVAVRAEMAEVEVFHGVGDDFGGDLGGSVVGEMAVPGEDALLDGPGALDVVLEEAEVVVGLEDEGARGADALDDKLGGVAEVGEEADIAEGVVEHEADGVVGVMRNGEAVDLKVAEGDGGARFEELPLGEAGHLGVEELGGEAVAIDGNGVAFGEDGEAADVVAVLVGEEDGLDVGDGATDGGEAEFDLFSAEAGIDEDARVLGLEVGAVAAAATSEDGETQHGYVSVFWRAIASR